MFTEKPNSHKELTIAINDQLHYIRKLFDEKQIDLLKYLDLAQVFIHLKSVSDVKRYHK